MSFYDIINGTLTDADKVMDNYFRTYNNYILNLIRMQLDRSIDFSSGYDDAWSEGFITRLGRESTVDEANTTAFFDGYQYCSGTDETSDGTISDPDSFTDASNAIDGDSTTYAYKNVASGTISLGTTFSARTVHAVWIKCVAFDTSTVITVQTYNGATWDDVEEIGTIDGGNKSFDGQVIIDSSVQGVRVEFDGGSSDARLYACQWTSTIEQSVVYLDIPSGSFPATIDRGIAKSLHYDWETGASIRFKLINSGGDDSGWMTEGERLDFSSFSSEPDQLVIEINPAGSPTQVIGIRGAGVYSE